MLETITRTYGFTRDDIQTASRYDKKLMETKAERRDNVSVCTEVLVNGRFGMDKWHQTMGIKAANGWHVAPTAGFVFITEYYVVDGIVYTDRDTMLDTISAMLECTRLDASRLVSDMPKYEYNKYVGKYIK